MTKQSIITAVACSILAACVAGIIVLLGVQPVAAPDQGQNLSGESRAPNIDIVSFNGVRSIYRRNGDTDAAQSRNQGALNTATTTVCAIQPSTTATTTLMDGKIRLDISSTTATTITIAKARTAFATTTLIYSTTTPANTQITALFASTTVSEQEHGNRTFAPGDWLVVGLSGGTGTFSPTGNCGGLWSALAVPN